MMMKLGGVVSVLVAAAAYVMFAMAPREAPVQVAAVTVLGWEDLLPPGHDPDAGYQDLVMPDGTEAIPESAIPDGSEDPAVAPTITQSDDDDSDGWGKVAEVPLDAAPPAPSPSATGAVDGEPPMSRFDDIPGLDEQPADTPTFAEKDIAAPAPVRAELDGKQVAIAGYMTPLQVEGERVRSFLLVPYVGACIHVPPPPANQVVLVEMEGDATVPLKDMWEPFTAVGRLRTQARETELADVGYTMKLERIAPYVEEEGQAN